MSHVPKEHKISETNSNIKRQFYRLETILAIQHEWKITLPVNNKCHEKYAVQIFRLSYCNLNPHPLSFCG